MEKIIFDKKMEFAIMFTPFYENDSFEGGTWLNFKVLQITSYVEVESLFKDKNEFLNVYEEDKICFGYIKWDGCMELHNLNYHFCGYDDILQRIVKCIYENAKELLGEKFDKDLANYE